MEAQLHVHFGSYFDKLPFSTEEYLRDFQAALPPDVQVIAIDSYDSPYGHLLPDGFGGADFDFMQIVDFAVGVGTVEGFKILAAAFLGRTGILLADRLFRPISKQARQASLEKAEEDRKALREASPTSNYEPSEENQAAHETPEAAFRGTYSITFYIRETREEHTIMFVDQDRVTAEGSVSETSTELAPTRDARVIRSTTTTYSRVDTVEEFSEKVTERLREILEDLE